MRLNRYSRYRGYNGQDSGATFGGYGADSTQMPGDSPDLPPADETAQLASMTARRRRRSVQ